jgi:tetratricopeptide (TPR) repeat protein
MASDAQPTFEIPTRARSLLGAGQIGGPGRPGAPRWAPWAAVLFVAVLAVVPFWAARTFEPVWDDPLLLEQLEALDRAGGVSALLRSEFRLLADRPTGYYRPFTAWSLVRDARPGFGSATAEQIARSARRLHRTNLLLHALCSALVLVLLWVLVGFGWSAVLGAVLFAVHPVHVEPAVFVSARADSMACAFALASTLAWIGARAAGMRAWHRRALLWLGAMAALLGALSKESALLLPLALLAWSLWLPPRVPVAPAAWWRSNREWILTWMVAVAAALALRLWVARVGFGTSEEASSAGGIAAFLRLGLPALLLYLRLWIVPWPLNAHYTSDQLTISLATAVAVAALATLTWWAARRGRGELALAGWAFALVFLLPVLHLAPLQGAAAAERFLYLPSVGLVLVVAAALAASDATPSAPKTRILAGIVMLASVGVAATATRPWRNNETLFTRMVASSPQSPVAHHGLASVYAEQGLQVKAIEHYRRTLELQPDHADALNGLAVAHIQMKNYGEARIPLALALRLRPDLPDAYTNMGIAYAMQDSYAVAIPYFVGAARLSPRSPRARFNLGLALWKVDDRDGARAELEVLQQLDASMAERLRAEMSKGVPPP